MVSRKGAVTQAASTRRSRPVEESEPSTFRQDQARQTRDSLIRTGLAIAERVGLIGMSVNRIVEEAGVAKGTFFHHFPDRSAFLVALHREFHERLLAEVSASVDGLAPGTDRLIRAANAYLDGCLRDRGVHAMLCEIRVAPQIAQAIAECSQQIAEVYSADFAAMGWADPLDSARLWNGLCAEAALLELDLVRRRPPLRAVLDQYLTTHRHR